MKVILDFEYLQVSEENEPTVIKTELGQLPNAGESFWYGETLYVVDERIWSINNLKEVVVTIYFKRVD